jgi:hypothetical protein
MPGALKYNLLIVQEIMNGGTLPLRKDGKNCPPGEDKTGDWFKKGWGGG